MQRTYARLCIYNAMELHNYTLTQACLITSATHHGDIVTTIFLQAVMHVIMLIITIYSIKLNSRLTMYMQYKCKFSNLSNSTADCLCYTDVNHTCKTCII